MASTPEISAWRIDRRKWQKSSFSGAGAQLEGGRWNSAGIPVVYASRNLAMAALETANRPPATLPGLFTVRSLAEKVRSLRPLGSLPLPRQCGQPRLVLAVEQAGQGSNSTIDPPGGMALLNG